jgi:hypothetical protein
MPQRNLAYPPEFHREAVRLVRASDEEHPIPRRSSPESSVISSKPRASLSLHEHHSLRYLSRFGGCSSSALMSR